MTTEPVSEIVFILSRRLWAGLHVVALEAADPSVRREAWQAAKLAEEFSLSDFDDVPLHVLLRLQAALDQQLAKLHHVAEKTGVTLR